MQIVKYEFNKNILTVGFKESDFVVYSQIFYDESKTKDNLLQEAYIQCRSAIEYEKTQIEHSFITETEGEEFIPQPPIPIRLNVDFITLTGKVLDQYGDVYSTDIILSVEGTDKARIDGKTIIEDFVTVDTEYFIVAKFEGLEEKQKRVIYAPKIVEPQTNNEIADIYEAIIGLDTRIMNLEGGM